MTLLISDRLSGGMGGLRASKLEWRKGREGGNAGIPVLCINQTATNDNYNRLLLYKTLYWESSELIFCFVDSELLLVKLNDRWN
jgi:hypothetical protein